MIIKAILRNKNYTLNNIDNMPRLTESVQRRSCTPINHVERTEEQTTSCQLNFNIHDRENEISGDFYITFNKAQDNAIVDNLQVGREYTLEFK